MILNCDFIALFSVILCPLSFDKKKKSKCHARNKRSCQIHLPQKKERLGNTGKMTFVSALQKNQELQHNVLMCNLTFPFKRVFKKKKSVHGFHC